MVFSALTAALFGVTGLALLVARDEVITEMEKVPEFRDANIDAEAAVGVLVAVMVGLVIWCLIAIVLSILVLRRSNVARILLVISSAAAAVLSLLGVSSGVSVVPLVATVATIVLLFTGGAGDWFKRVSGYSGVYPGAPTAYPGGQYGNPYGSPYGVQPGPDAPPTYPQADNPYGQQPPGAENPYGQQPPSEDGTHYPPWDYPNR
jgi:hypothetical protein